MIRFRLNVSILEVMDDLVNHNMWLIVECLSNFGLVETLWAMRRFGNRGITRNMGSKGQETIPEIRVH